MQLLRTRPFFWLWLTHLAGMLANELASISVVVLVFATTGSTLQATGVLVARNLPPLLFGPFAGSIVDRLPRQATLVVANLLRAGLVGLFLLAGTEAGSGIWLGYLLVFCLTLVDLVHKPALLSLLPTIAPPDRLVQANSIIFSTTQVAFMLSYGVGGLLAASGGPQLLGTLMLGLFVVAALTAALIGRAAPVATSTAREPFWSTVIAGFTYLRDHQLARTLITVEFFESWPHGVWTSALMLGFTVDALKAGPEAWGYQSAAFFGGQFLGALLALTFAARLGQRPGWIIIGNAFLMGGLTLAYAASSSVLMAVLISIAFGPPFALRDVAQDSLIQTSVAPEMLGRVYAAREMFARMAFLLGGLLFASLADLLAIRSIYALGGLLYCATAFYSLASAPLRQSQIAASADRLAL